MLDNLIVNQSEVPKETDRLLNEVLHMRKMNKSEKCIVGEIEVLETPYEFYFESSVSSPTVANVDENSLIFEEHVGSGRVMFLMRYSMDIGGPLYVYLLLAFLLIYLPTRSVGKCNNLQHASSLPCSEKYLSESYFNKHDILVDSNFQSFLKHGFPLRPCKSLENLNTVIKVPVLHRDLIGEGSHRRLFSSLRVSIQPHTTISELPEHFCEAVVIERLPSGVFADPFELQHLVQSGVLADAAVFGDTNLELPSALSNRSVVEVHMDIGHNILSKHTDELQINLELPLHARYPPLDGSGYSNVEMSIPDLFIRCSTERNAVCERCFWAKRAEHFQSLADALHWRIPSGKKAHSQVVSYVTFTAAFLSTMLIVLAAVCYSPNTSSSKKLKKLRKS